MITLIVGKKGSGKTKQLINLINAAAENAHGNVVCVEKGAKLTYDIKHSIRLIDVETYGIDGYDAFYGFITGIMAGNYDISEIYVDSILKIGGCVCGLGDFLSKVEPLLNDIKLVLTVSADESELPDSVKKYL